MPALFDLSPSNWSKMESQRFPDCEVCVCVCVRHNFTLNQGRINKIREEVPIPAPPNAGGY